MSRAEAQGKYESCLFKWGCARTMAPWITVYANANGNWNFDFGS